jgi:hypothetical protein
MKYSDNYWFARGYYDGRTKGVDDIEPARAISDMAVVFYKAGYDAGVADYCADMEQEED